MNNKIKRLLIIPARKNSKRIKLKNIKNFCGQPIIWYPIKAAIKSKLFAKIHVSSDSNEIIKKINKLKIKTDFLRKKNLSDGKTSIIKVIKHVNKCFENKGEFYDQIWCILPCNPLINEKDLIKAANFFDLNNKKPIISICKYDCPIEWAFKMKNNNILTPIDYKQHSKRSQDLESKYYDAGIFYIYQRQYLKAINEKKIYNCYRGFEIDREKVVDIDTTEDWKFAETIYKGRIK